MVDDADEDFLVNVIIGVSVSDRDGEGGAAVAERVELCDRESVVVFEGEGTGESVAVGGELTEAVGERLRSLLSVVDMDPEIERVTDMSFVGELNEGVRLDEISFVREGTLLVCAVTYVLVPLEGVIELDPTLEMLTVGVSSFVTDEVELILNDRLFSLVGV